MLDPYSRHLWRMAHRIHHTLTARQAHLPDDLLPHAAFQRLTTVEQMLGNVHARGWIVARTELAADYDRQCDGFINQLQQSRDALRRAVHPGAVAPVQEIWRDLLALDDEFEEADCDLGTTPCRSSPTALS